MATIQLSEVEKRFGEDYAVKPMNLTIEDGEFVVLLGPSGCGKTTTLRMISGLEAVTDGIIRFDGDDVTWLSSSDRDIAFVFQFFALYSHMTCRENIAFPLQALGGSRSEVNRRVAEVAELVQIGHLLDKRPGGLSGGDQQRVALARALVRRPRAFLMDEPLGALDAEFREGMRAEIKRLHLELEATTIYVTHDQTEAMAMGDKIVVMSDAVVQQVGSPAEVYYQPANLFVARFIGSPGMNLLEGHYQDGSVRLEGGNSYPVPDAWKATLDGAIGSGKLIVGFRPEAVELGSETDLRATVYTSDMHGGHAMLHLDIGAGIIVHARAARSERHPMGSTLHFRIDAEQVRFFDPDSGLALSRDGAS